MLTKTHNVIVSDFNESLMYKRNIYICWIIFAQSFVNKNTDLPENDDTMA